MIRYLIFIASLNVSYAAAQPGLNFSALKTQLDNQAPKILQKHAAAGLHTTAMDLARFNLAILKNELGEYNGAQLLPKALIADMTTPAANAGGRWSMSYVVDQSNTSLGFAGFNRGWVSLSCSMTAQNIGYVILTNSSIGQITNELDSFILSKVAESQAN